MTLDLPQFQATVGQSVPIRIKVRRRSTDQSLSGQLFPLTGISATVQKPDGTLDSTVPVITYVRDGEYLAYWDSTGKVPGNYRIKFVGIVNDEGRAIGADAIIALLR